MHGSTRHGVRFGDAADGLPYRVRSRQMCIGAAWPVSGDGDIHEAGVYFSQILIAEAVLLGRAGAEILAENVRPLYQLVEDLSALFGLQVQGQAFDPPVVGFEVGAGVTRHRAGGSRAVAGTGHLDFDHLRTEIGH